MAATGIGNPNGAVMVFDGGTPRSVSGKVFKTTISGGTFCFQSGATGVVGSGADSFATSDILFHNGASGTVFNGIALNTAASGALVSVATRGMFILPTDATVEAGTLVQCDGQQVQTVGSVAANLAALRPIGRAVTAGASGGFLIVDIHG